MKTGKSNKPRQIYQHPHDPGVLIATTREAFIRAAQSRTSDAVIWKRDLPPKLLRAYAGAIHRGWETTAPENGRSTVFSGDPNQISISLQYTPLKKELSNLLRIFKEIAYCRTNIHSGFMANLAKPEHTDPFDILNVSYNEKFGNLGLGWKNPNDETEILTSETGNPILMRAGFKHLTPHYKSELTGPRYTLVVCGY